jgi:hypothetical protein
MFNFLTDLFNSYVKVGIDTSAVKGSVPRLLESAIEGSNQVLLTPFGEQNGPDQLLKEFDALYNSSSQELSDDLLELELSQRAKFGPRSIQKNWVERRPSVTDYFSDVTLSNDKIDSIKSVIPIAAQLHSARNSLRPLSDVNTLKYLKNSTNSGLPYFRRKGLIKSQLISDLPILEELAREEKTPCVMFTRTQEQGKTRAVWGYPIFHTFKEMRFFQPFLQLEKKFPWRSALVGPESTDLRIQSLLRSIRDDETFISIDFSAYDASINFQLIQLAFNFIIMFFQPSYTSTLFEIASTMSSIGLLTPDGILTGLHGVPSGSTFTNTVDSIVQYLVVLSMLTNPNIPNEVVYRILEFCSIQGDDGAYMVPDKYIDLFIENFQSFGLNVNVEKSYQSKETVIFLQLLYTKDRYEFGVYPVYRALNRLIFLERFTQFSDEDLTGKDYFGIRAISILENCKNHPLHTELVLFVARRNKYSLLPSAEGLKKYSEFISKKSGADDIIYHQYGQKTEGLFEFQTVKVLVENGF